MVKIFSSIISLVLIALITIFAISNREVVELGMFPLIEKYSMPIYAIVLLSVLFGFLLGVFVMSWGLLKANIRNRVLHRTIKDRC